jgi:hypothetical protein
MSRRSAFVLRCSVSVRLSLDKPATRRRSTSSLKGKTIAWPDGREINRVVPIGIGLVAIWAYTDQIFGSIGTWCGRPSCPLGDIRV